MMAPEAQGDEHGLCFKRLVAPGVSGSLQARLAGIVGRGGHRKVLDRNAVDGKDASNPIQGAESTLLSTLVPDRKRQSAWARLDAVFITRIGHEGIIDLTF